MYSFIQMWKNMVYNHKYCCINNLNNSLMNTTQIIDTFCLCQRLDIADRFYDK